MNNDALEILNHVNQYYNNAFTTLLTVTLAVLGFVGVIVPAVIQFYQSRVFQRDKKSTEEYIKNLIKESKIEIDSYINDSIKNHITTLDSTISEKIGSAKKELHQRIISVEGKTWHGIAVSCAASAKYDDALRCNSNAAYAYMTCEDEENLVVALDNVLKNIISLKTLDADSKEIVRRIADHLAKFNKNGRYKKYLTELSNSIR